jgi:flagellar basal-body rod protein FlgB
MIEKLLSSPTYDGSKMLLDVAIQRQQAIASNLANIETPSYKRVEVEKGFSAVFAKALNAGSPLKAGLPKVVTDLESPAQRKDGNNVILQDELMAMSKNSAEYEALGEFVSFSMRTLRMAITGRTNS